MNATKQFFAWIWRGFLSRIASAMRILPFPVHRRSEAVSELTQVEPPEEHPMPPRPEHAPKSHAGDPVVHPQQHVNPAPPLEHGHPKR